MVRSSRLWLQASGSISWEFYKAPCANAACTVDRSAFRVLLWISSLVQVHLVELQS